MNVPHLQKYLISILNIEEDQIGAILENCRTRSVKKDEFLVREHDICRHTFFVETGLLRQFSIDEKGREHILMFAPENWFVLDRQSAYFNEPAAYYIQALEDSEVALIDEKFIRQLSAKVPAFTDINTKLLHNHIRHLQNRINMLLGASAEDRYLEFLKMYPNILMRVPQSMIASYLGIAPESLSRVRKQLAARSLP